MAQVLWNDSHRALAYACSEMAPGEVMTLNEAANTVTITNHNTKAVILAGGTTIAAAKTHVAPVHPKINLINT